MKNTFSEDYASQLFEIHKWGHPLLPFIFHTDIVNSDMGRGGNWHDSLEILQAVEGRGKVVCNRNTFEFTKGDIVIINSGDIHRISSDSEIKFHCLIVGFDFCMDNGIDIKKIKFAAKIKNEKACRLVNDAVTNCMSIGMNNIRASLPGKPGIGDGIEIAELRSSFLALLIYLCKNHSEQFENRASGFNTVTAGMEYINRNFYLPLTLEDIASKVGVSKYHFIREFKRYTGSTVFTYINTLRCEYAKRLFVNEKLSVGEVADRCGFENFSYFTRTFKRYTGDLPSHFLAK